MPGPKYVRNGVRRPPCPCIGSSVIRLTHEALYADLLRWDDLRCPIVRGSDSAVPDELTDEAISIDARNLGFDLAIQTVDSFRQAHLDAKALGQAHDSLRPAFLPPPAGEADTNRPAGQGIAGNGGVLHGH